MEVTLQSFRKRFTYDPAKDLLGKGGFGEVYKAYDNEDHIYVALKISHAATDDKYNLISEIKRFKKLSHPNIVKHIEAYEVNTGSTDIHGKPILYHVGILEYANNGTLADLLKKEKTDYRLIEDLAKDIIEGLAYLHSENIIHRDLKPTNILLFSEGEKLRAKITDFGIAKRTDATAASTQLVGTVEYMAPEFFSTGNITPASDVWSVGVMLLEALTGTHPFGKTTQGLSNEQIINNILNKDLSTATQNLTEPLKGIITRCLLRETNLRPQSATELQGLLQQGGDAFSEKTQVISAKSKIAIDGKPKSQLIRWGVTLLDFEVRNGKWKKVLARELLIAVTIPILMGAGFGLICLSWDCVFDEQEALIDPIIGILSFLFFRGLIKSVIWAFEELGFSFPTITGKTSKAIKYLLIIVFLIILLPISVYFAYEKLRIKNESARVPDVTEVTAPDTPAVADFVIPDSAVESISPTAPQTGFGVDDHAYKPSAPVKPTTKNKYVVVRASNGNMQYCFSKIINVSQINEEIEEDVRQNLAVYYHGSIQFSVFKDFSSASEYLYSFSQDCKIPQDLIKSAFLDAGIWLGH